MNATMQAPGMYQMGGQMMQPPVAAMPQGPGTMAAPGMHQWTPQMPPAGPAARPQVSPEDVARLRQERALQYQERLFGQPHAYREFVPRMGQGQMDQMIARIRQARGLQ